MILQTILVLILLANLRKQTRKNAEGLMWERRVIAAIIVSSGLLVLHTTVSDAEVAATIASYGLSILIFYLVFTQQIFAPAKSIALAFLPLVAIKGVEDLLEIFHRPTFKSWYVYLESAALFALVWMIAMLILSSRQRKALERERIKAEERERELQITEKLKQQLEKQVQERTAEITRQKEELQKALHELKETQSQLIHSEKMASLGELTAGIAHEIQNPLNFVNNFSEINGELLDEMREAIEKGDYEEVKQLASDIADNQQKINMHGKRADSIVKGMLQHSRTSTGQKEPTDINALCDECLRLSFHGLRAKDKSFNAAFETKFDPQLPKIDVIPQEIGRVILNLCNNAFFSTNEKKKTAEGDFKPVVSIETMARDNGVVIIIKDNGSGIPQSILDKIFQPFFTTKPTGQGTGLGLSMSYDIITKGHNGTLQVESKENSGATFTIFLPNQNA